jgi:hypothetical protein
MRKVQEEREAKVKTYAPAVERILREVLPRNVGITWKITDGGLTFTASFPTPLPDRKNANGLLDIRIPRDILDDWLLPAQTQSAAEARLGEFVRAGLKTYTPKPSKVGGVSPESEIWVVKRDDVKVKT